MQFGIQKCVTLVMQRGKKVDNNGILLPDGRAVINLGVGSYKYLDVVEANGVKI